MLTSVIAELNLCAAHPNGEAAETRIRVSKPRRARDGTWRCRCEIRGLPAEEHAQSAERARSRATSVRVNRSAKPSRPTLRGDIAGEDALQALMLGTGFVAQVLEAFVAGGGRLTYPDGMLVNLGVYFPPTRGRVVAQVI